MTNTLAVTSKVAEKQRLKNKKKKERKKLSRINKLVKKAAKEAVSAIESESTEDERMSIDLAQEAVDEQNEDMPKFELRGPFERFRLVFTEKNEGAKSDNNVRKNSTSHSDMFSDTVSSDSESLKALASLPFKARAAAIALEDPRPEKDAEEQTTTTLSKKQLKKLNRMTVGQLKQEVVRPDLVEMWDVCSRDPKMLLHLKSLRNAVPVPKHWCAKRKYLSGKRGFEKPPFHLPDYIAATGIIDMRESIAEKESEKTLKSKMREKIRPKVGKVDIDYHKLHDAFFRYQTKPRMTIHGDLYYEGKEFEIKLKEKKPGQLSDELRTALGLPSGISADRYPPPWLIAMQRYGPPPSYPNLKIAGLNAPIPEGCSFGYHASGWGKPPVDEQGRPIYGDVFGNGGQMASVPPHPPPPPIADAEEESGYKHWGEFDSDEESEESESSSDEEDRPVGTATPAGLITPSGISSFGGTHSLGLTTPEAIELRKKSAEEIGRDSSGATSLTFTTGRKTDLSSQLYRVLPEVPTSVGSALVGSSKLYSFPKTKDANAE